MSDASTEIGKSIEDRERVEEGALFAWVAPYVEATAPDTPPIVMAVWALTNPARTREQREADAWRVLNASSQPDTTIVQELAEVLKPFADEADTYDPPEADDEMYLWNAQSGLRVKHLRAARALLARASSLPAPVGDWNAAIEAAAKVADDFMRFAFNNPNSKNVHALTARDIGHTIRALARPQPGGREVSKWRIWVSGYGTFDFEGNEAEAEEMRAHKARWEGGNGQKWRADLSRESDRLTAEIVALWDAGSGVPQSLLKQRKKAREAEAAIGEPRP